MTDPRNSGPQSTAHGTHRYDDLQHYDMPTRDRRMRFWDMANGILCALFLRAPMGIATFRHAA